MPCIEEPATRSHLGPVEYTPHSDDDGGDDDDDDDGDGDDTYLLQLVLHPVALVGWLLQK